MIPFKIRKVIRLLFPLFGLSFTAWMILSLQARELPNGTFDSDSSILVQNGKNFISFVPRSDTTNTSLIFYPGALVDPDAYAPIGRALAEHGYSVHIMRIPFRMAINAKQEAQVFLETLDFIHLAASRSWHIAGHSRGARMALSFAEKHSEVLNGVQLIGTSHPREKNLSWLAVPVLKVYGSEDGLASQTEVEDYKHNLPDHTQWVLIEGGNHAQFAWYGNQFGDHKASIPREKQQAQLIQAMLTFLK